MFSQETFRKALLKWLVVSDEPFSTVQEQAFIDMVKTLNPDAKLYSDKTVRSDLMDTFNEKFTELKEKLKSVPGKMSITMDGWTSRNILPFLAIRAHWLDDQWEYQSQLLDFCHIEGSHSGANFRDIFAKALQSLGVPLDKIVSITVDNASSNDTFFDELEDVFDILGDDQHIRCLAHIINLAAQDVLKSLKSCKTATNTDEEQPDEDLLAEEVLDDIDLDQEIDCDSDDDEPIRDYSENTVLKLRTLVRKIRKSVQMRQKLNKLCKIYSVKYLVPILDVKTRWNSTYDMILRAEHLRTPLRVLCSGEKTLASLHITDQQWFDMLEIKHLLQKFHRATQLVSMERHSTIHAYLPTLDWLIVSLKSIVRGPTGLINAAKAGLEKLQKYNEIIQASKIPFIATFLNPAMKLNYFKEQKYPNSKIREIKNRISDYFDENYGDELFGEEPQNSQSEDDDELFSHMFKRSKPDRISSEIQKYLDLPLSKPTTSSLDYWRSKSTQDEFPGLSKMARDFLPIQSASTAVERDFSKGAHVVTPTRCSITSETIRATMFLKSWFDNNA